MTTPNKPEKSESGRLFDKIMEERADPNYRISREIQKLRENHGKDYLA